MLTLSAQLRIRLLILVAFSFCAATWTLWKGETLRAEKDVRTLLEINYRDVSRGFTDRADYQLTSIARDLANRFGSAGKLSSVDVAALCAEEEIAEIYDIDTRGIVVGGSRLVGEKVRGEQWSEFLRLLDPDGPESMSQPDRPRTSDGKVFKYAAARYPDRSGYVEVGWSEERFLKFLRQRAYGYTRSWHIDERGYIVFVDGDGIVTSHADMSLAGKTFLEATGIDPSTVQTGTLFRATIAGEPMFCYAGPVRNYLAFLADPVTDAFASRDRFMPRMVAVLLAIFALLFAFVSLMLRTRVAGSVRRIGDALRRIAGGNLGVRVDVRTSREFSELSDNINSTVTALRHAAEERVHRIEADLELGRTIQRAALPADSMADESWSLAASMEAAREVGGDFYDYFLPDATHLAFLVADVSGKGVTAALYMMRAKTLIKETLNAVHDPAEALDRVNEDLCRNNPANMFLTAWVGVLDLETGRVAFANAGHNPPLFLRPGAAPDWIREKSGCPLGCFEGVTYKRRELALCAGDSLFLYSDGVTEATDAKGELFGEARLLEAMKAAHAAGGPVSSLASIARAAVSAFAEGVPQADDITVLAMRYRGAPKTFVRTFPATRDGISAASGFLDEVAPAQPKEMASWHIILDEICSNIVKHSGASGFEIIIEVVQTLPGVKITFIDDGVAFDPLAHVDPDTNLSATDRPVGGLGILMVKKMSSSVSYRRANNHNFLIVERIDSKAPGAGVP